MSEVITGTPAVDRPQTLAEAYAEPDNFLEIDVCDPKTEMEGTKKFTTYEVRVRDEHAEKEDDGMTPAERAFAKEQAKREAARIREKAMKTHKEKVQELNKKLDTMTEHHDIPKVSWTK